jgi:hypothetical protein
MKRRGVPELDSIEINALIDERARQVMEREKVEAQERERLDALRRSVAIARERVETFWLRPLKLRNREIGIPSAGAVKLLGGLMLFLFFNGFVFLSPYVPWTPAAVVCPLVCEGCVVSTRSSYQSTGASHMPDTTTVCRNSKIGIDQLDGGQLMSDARLDQYRINIVLRFIIDFISFLLVVAPLVWWRLARVGWFYRRAHATELRRLEMELDAALGHPLPSATDAPYR